MAYEQHLWRGRNDDGDETGATWQAATNTTWTQDPTEPFRVRIGFREIDGVADSGVYAQLWARLNGAGDHPVQDASQGRPFVHMEPSPHVANSEDCTDQLGGPEPYVAENNGFDDGDGFAGGTASFAGNDRVEFEFCCRLIEADVSEGDTVELYVQLTGGRTITITEHATLTVGGSGASGTLSATLDGATVEASGDTPAEGQASATLGGATAAAAGAVGVEGALEEQLEGATGSAAGAVSAGPSEGSLEVSLAGAFGAGQGRILVTGQVSATLAGATSSTLTVKVPATAAPLRTGGYHAARLAAGGRVAADIETG